MTDLPQIMSIMDAVLIPLAAGIALMLAKLTRGEMARKAEKNFFAFLVVMTLITIRTVVLCEEVWLIHTTTLAIMIVGALAIPSHDTLLDREATTTHQYQASPFSGRQMT